LSNSDIIDWVYGTWGQSCTLKKYEKGKSVTADCRKSDGKYVETKVSSNGCRKSAKGNITLSNQNGVLTCTK
jgi:hypothetical protein